MFFILEQYHCQELRLFLREAYPQLSVSYYYLRNIIYVQCAIASNKNMLHVMNQSHIQLFPYYMRWLPRVTRYQESHPWSHREN